MKSSILTHNKSAKPNGTRRDMLPGGREFTSSVTNRPLATKRLINRRRNKAARAARRKNR